MKRGNVENLVRRAAEGDEAAARELAHRYERQLRSTIHSGIGRDLRPRVGTSDVLQSTMLAALGQLDRFEYRSEPAFLSWLNAIAERKLLMAARFHSARKRDVRRERLRTVEPPQPANQPSPSQGAVQAEFTQLVQNAVLRLPSLERRVVQLHSFEGRSFARVAEELGLSGHARARYVFQRALKLLGRMLDDAC